MLALTFFLIACFLGNANAACSGTLYFKPPANWANAYVIFEMNATPITTFDDGYYVIDLTDVRGSGWNYTSFSLGAANCTFNCTGIINPAIWNGNGSHNTGNTGNIPCPGERKSVYVQEDPENPGSTYIGSIPAKARYFYVQVPSSEDWRFSTPVISSNDGTTSQVMHPVPNRCGWYSIIWSDFNVPEEAVIVALEDTTQKLGVDKLFLDALFAEGKDTVFYSPEKDLISYTDPHTNGYCQSGTFHVLIPNTEEWFGRLPALSLDDGKTLIPMESETGTCGWYKVNLQLSNDFSKARIYSTDKKAHFGKNLLSDVPFNLLKEIEKSENGEVFFVPFNGVEWTLTKPEKDISCSYYFTGVIYDSDETLNPLFSSDGMTSGFGACTGVRQGIVKESLNPKTHKPVFNAGDSAATLCAGTENNFNSLFNFVQDVNEVSCYSFEFKNLNDGGRWGYNSDMAINGTTVGGFAPVENTTDDDILSEPCEICRTKRLAQGPVPHSLTQDGYEKYCNTAGWFGGRDCRGMFSNGDSPAIWSWGASRWTSERNQQFCFESHATFKYHEGQTFTVMGDDDIWVFINNKLVVDLGGAHLAAPGFVDLKNLNTTFGENFLQEDSTYNFDFFFCDRRTTMSNMTIKTNIYLTQKEAKQYLHGCKIQNQDILVDEEDIFLSSSSPKPTSSASEVDRDDKDDDVGDDENESSSSSKKETIPEISMAKFTVSTNGRTISISSEAEAFISIMDVQGHTLYRMLSPKKNASITVQNPGLYIVRTGNGVKTVRIK